MKLYIPLRNWVLSQPFAKNYNTYYAEDKLAGHTGADYVALGEDKTVYASHDGYVFSVLNKDNKDLMRYRCVFTLIEDNGVFYELSYGHFFDIYVSEGQTVKRGDKLGVEGNTGDVASGGKKVTLAEKKAGSTAGRHVHLQLRPVLPVEKRTTGKKYLQDAKGYFKKDGMFFERIPNPPFADCIDPAPFMVNESAAPKSVVEKVTEVFKPQFKRVLRYGSRGSDVKSLQSLLGIKVDGIFGVGTRQAVMDFQKANNLIVDGIAGAQTFTKLLK